MTKRFEFSLENDLVIAPFDNVASQLPYPQYGSVREYIKNTCLEYFNPRQKKVLLKVPANCVLDKFILKDLSSEQLPMNSKLLFEYSSTDCFGSHLSSIHNELSAKLPSMQRGASSQLATHKSKLNCRAKRVWYLDADVGVSEKIIGRLGNRAVFPLVLPIPSLGAWPIFTWSDYLFSTLTFALFQSLIFSSDLNNAVEIGENCNIHSSAQLVPPVKIGDRVQVGAGAIVSSCIIGDDCRIGQGSNLSLSWLAEGVSLPMAGLSLMSILHKNSVVNSPVRFSVVGENAFIGAGVFITDTRLTRREAHISESYVVSNGFNTKSIVLGCAIGPNVQIGSGVILKPGSVIASGERLLPASKFF